MIEQFYADSELYLDFLNIDKSEIPTKNDKLDKQEFCKLVENKFRSLTRKYHPDFGGSEEAFKFLLKCKQVFLEDELGIEREVFLKIDDNRFSNFDKSSLAARLGNQIFDLICLWKNDLNIKPLFKPSTEDHEYEWIFGTSDPEIQLSLNVQNLTDEYAELSHKTYSDNNLNVLVCLFVPSKKLAVTNCAYDQSVMLTFNDKILIESSNAKSISEYFSTKESLQIDLQKIMEGSFKSRENELKTKNVKKAIALDKKVSDYLQNIKIFSTDYDESAADFIDKL